MEILETDVEDALNPVNAHVITGESNRNLG